MTQNLNNCTDKTAGDLLVAYEMGLLSAKEQALVETHLNDCDSCSEQMWQFSPAVETIHTRPGQLAREMRGNWWSRAVSWLEHLETIPRWRLAMPAMAAAAVVLLLLIVSGPWDQSDSARLARIEPLPYIQLQTRGGETGGEITADGEALFDAGMERYVQGAYGEAAVTLASASRQFTVPGVAKDQADLFAGLSYLLTSEVDSAAVYLTSARQSRTPVIADRASWFLAQAALQRGDLDEARLLLEMLAAGSPGYDAEAKDQLERLNALTGPH
jgi:Putative zinc-finger